MTNPKEEYNFPKSTYAILPSTPPSYSAKKSSFDSSKYIPKTFTIFSIILIVLSIIYLIVVWSVSSSNETKIGEKINKLKDETPVERTRLFNEFLKWDGEVFDVIGGFLTGYCIAVALVGITGLFLLGDDIDKAHVIAIFCFSLICIAIGVTHHVVFPRYYEKRKEIFQVDDIKITSLVNK